MSAPAASARQDTARTAQPAPPSKRSLVQSINLCIYRYNLSTALYMLQPWERALFNTIVIAIVAYIAYGLYNAALHPLFERLAISYM
ncbi:unnamed protein product [Agarophyton chilense]